MPRNVRDSRALRRRLTELDQKLTEDDLADRDPGACAGPARQLREPDASQPRLLSQTDGGALLLASAATVFAALSAPAWVTAVVAALFTSWPASACC
jgi:hypothetical protein